MCSTRVGEVRLGLASCEGRIEEKSPHHHARLTRAARAVSTPKSTRVVLFSCSAAGGRPRCEVGQDLATSAPGPAGLRTNPHGRLIGCFSRTQGDPVFKGLRPIVLHVVLPFPKLPGAKITAESCSAV